jgi:hypothetical protein
MPVKVYLGPVIQPCAAHGAIVQPEACDTNNVKRNASRRAQPRYVSGVRRYLGLDQRNANHD